MTRYKMQKRLDHQESKYKNDGQETTRARIDLRKGTRIDTQNRPALVSTNALFQLIFQLNRTNRTFEGILFSFIIKIM